MSEFRILVYVFVPNYTGITTEHLTHQAEIAVGELGRRRHLPQCSYLMPFWQKLYHTSHDEWVDYTFGWMARCDIGFQTGPIEINTIQDEGQFALALGIPMYTTYEELEKRVIEIRSERAIS